MTRHKPIKFEPIEDQNIIKKVKSIVEENKIAKTTVNVAMAIAITGGVLTVGAIAPNFLGMVLRSNKNRKRRKQERYEKIWRSFNSLRQKQLIEFVHENKDGSFTYRVSEKGKKRIKKFMFDEMVIPTPKTWDNKWQLVLFDIPERHKKARNSLTRKLKELNFYQCQKSAWIYPFPCNDEIKFITELFSITPFVKIFSVDKMTDGKTLYHFKNTLKKTVTR